MALSEDVSRIAGVAAQHRAPGQQVVAVLTVETAAGERIYLAAYEDGAAEQMYAHLVWLRPYYEKAWRGGGGGGGRGGGGRPSPSVISG